MSIETRCPSCSKLLRVPDEAAGKRIRCPACQHVITPGGEQPVVAAPSPQIPAPRPAAVLWTVQTEDGQQFGPISKMELDQWVAEGRVNTGCQLLQAGSAQWQWASEVYPQLSSAAPAAAPQPAGYPGIDTSGQGGGSPFEVSKNPYASPGGGGGSSVMQSRNIPDHLPMAIFALICCGGVFAIPAIVYAA